MKQLQMSFSKLESQQADHDARLGAIEADLEAEAGALLDRLADPEARRRYATIAERLGWPCWSVTWEVWAGA